MKFDAPLQWNYCKHGAQGRIQSAERAEPT